MAPRVGVGLERMTCEAEAVRLREEGDLFGLGLGAAGWEGSGEDDFGAFEDTKEGSSATALRDSSVEVEAASFVERGRCALTKHLHCW